MSSIGEIMNKVIAHRVLTALLYFMSCAVQASPFTFEFNLPAWDQGFGNVSQFGSNGILDVTLNNGSNSSQNQTYLNSQITQVTLKAAGGGAFNATWSDSLGFQQNSSYFSTNSTGVPTLTLSPLNVSVQGVFGVNAIGQYFQLANPIAGPDTGSYWPVSVATTLNLNDANLAWAAISTRVNGIYNGLQLTGKQITTTTSPLTLEQLVRFSGDAYAGGNYPVAGYQAVTLGVGPSTGGFGAAAFVNNAGSQVVLALAGTDDPLDLLADSTFLAPSGEPTPIFKTYVADAVSVVRSLRTEYPNATITLTGHSLGGALAQVLASASGLSAVTFDAPGPKQTLPYLTDQLHLLNSWPPSPAQQITNYRVYGDLVSTVGTQVGSTTTYVTPVSPSYLVDLFPVATFKPLHLLSTILERIVSNAGTTSSIGPTALGQGIDLANQIAQPTPVGTIQWGVNGTVTALNPFFIDPGGADAYLLAADPGSPWFRSVQFPFLLNLDAYFRLEEWIGNSWTPVGFFDELSTFDFGPQGIDQFRFFVLDRNTFQPPSTVEEFTFAVTFVSDGIFTGTLHQFSSVPEPATLALLTLGLTGLGFSRRRQ